MAEKRIKTIDRVSAIFDCFAEDNSPQRLTDLSEKLNINKSTLHGLLASLIDNGFIQQDEKTQLYSLGYKFIFFGEVVSSSFKIIEIAKNELDYLQTYFNETIHLAALEGQSIVYIDKRDSKQSIQIYTRVGKHVPAHCCSTGKVMLSYRGESFIESTLPEKLEKWTDKTIETRDELIELSSKIRKLGYATDDEENMEGLSCVGVPVFDYAGNVPYAISVAMPTSRRKAVMNEDNIKILQNVALEVSKKLGYRNRDKKDS